MTTTSIKTLPELVQALQAGHPQTLVLQTALVSPHALTLPPGYALTSADKDRCTLSFSQGDGLGLTANNEVYDLVVLATPASRAIYTLTGWADMGKLTLRNLTVMGQVSLIARPGTTQLTVVADQVDVVACDARHYSEQPQKYGVNVVQGAFTVYNFAADEGSHLTATLTNLTAGRRNAPVLGSGIFVSGFGDASGPVTLKQLTTGAVYANGLLPAGTADVITAGVFVVYGVQADEVACQGEIVTYGVNDMVLDNWGTVQRWTTAAPIVSYGPSAIGFVNFGTVEGFVAAQEVVTYGPGARGFNQYDGTVKRISFQSITTHGDGSVGIQISKPVGTIEVRESVTTYGATGNTLVKGVIEQLAAEALSVKAGGEVQHLRIGGGLVTHGPQITAYALEGGKVDELRIDGLVLATGQGATAIVVAEDGSTPLTNVQVHAPAGQVLRQDEGGTITDQTGYSPR